MSLTRFFERIWIELDLPASTSPLAGTMEYDDFTQGDSVAFWGSPTGELGLSLTGPMLRFLAEKSVWQPNLDLTYP